MLKVMKYDWKNGWENIRLLMLLAAVVTVAVGIGMRVLDKNAGLLSVVWFAVMLALLVLTVDLIFRNMSGRMFGAGGYLTHTLPVETWELLLGKTAGTWAFGVVMVFAAAICWLVLMLISGTDAGTVKSGMTAFAQMLPKLGDYFFQNSGVGFGYVLLCIPAFLIASFLLMVQFQFVCIIARAFGRYYIAGGIIVFLVMGIVEGLWNHATAMGFIAVPVCSVICFGASWWLLKHRLSV